MLPGITRDARREKIAWFVAPTARQGQGVIKNSGFVLPTVEAKPISQTPALFVVWSRRIKRTAGGRRLAHVPPVCGSRDLVWIFASPAHGCRRAPVWVSRSPTAVGFRVSALTPGNSLELARTYACTSSTPGRESVWLTLVVAIEFVRRREFPLALRALLLPVLRPRHLLARADDTFVNQPAPEEADDHAHHDRIHRLDRTRAGLRDRRDRAPVVRLRLRVHERVRGHVHARVRHYAGGDQRPTPLGIRRHPAGPAGELATERALTTVTLELSCFSACALLFQRVANGQGSRRDYEFTCILRVRVSKVKSSGQEKALALGEAREATENQRGLTRGPG